MNGVVYSRQEKELRDVMGECHISDRKPKGALYGMGLKQGNRLSYKFYHGEVNEADHRRRAALAAGRKYIRLHGTTVVITRDGGKTWVEVERNLAQELHDMIDAVVREKNVYTLQNHIWQFYRVLGEFTAEQARRIEIAELKWPGVEVE